MNKLATQSKVSISSVMRGTQKCKAHKNYMASANIQFRVHQELGAYRSVGEVRMSFIGCKCIEIKGVK